MFILLNIHLFNVIILHINKVIFAIFISLVIIPDRLPIDRDRQGSLRSSAYSIVVSFKLSLFEHFV